MSMSLEIQVDELQGEIDELYDRIIKIEAERDLYRDALEEIKHDGDDPREKGYTYKRIANQALKGEDDE